MRNWILVFTIILLGTIAYAQDFQGGFLGGLNAARIDGDGHERYGKLGLNAGFFVSRPTQIDNLFWQMEVKYTSRGSYHTYISSGTLIGWDLIDLRYFELPFSLHYDFMEKMQAEIGLSPDFLFREYFATHDGVTPAELAPDLRTLGITAFLGYNYFFHDRLALGFRFNYSVIPFYKFDAYAVRYRDSGWFHDVLSVHLKYYLLK